MARSIETIYAEYTTRFVAECAAVGVTIDTSQWSQVNILRLIFYTITLLRFVEEKLFDTLKLEIDETIAAKKPHSLRWYAEKAKAFMFGYALIPDSDTYNTTGLTEAQITAAKIVKHAAVVEQLVGINRYGLRIKVAKTVGSDLGALTTPELTALSSYFEDIKDAGVPLLLTTGPADALKLKLDVYYNPQVLNATGQRLDGTTLTPVQDVIAAYLKNLPFNGLFVLEYLEDEVQATDGVVIGRITSATAAYGALPHAAIDVKYQPDAGYLRLYNTNDLEITFIPQNVIR